MISAYRPIIGQVMNFRDYTFHNRDVPMSVRLHLNALSDVLIDDLNHNIPDDTARAIINECFPGCMLTNDVFVTSDPLTVETFQYEGLFVITLGDLKVATSSQSFTVPKKSILQLLPEHQTYTLLPSRKLVCLKWSKVILSPIHHYQLK